MMRRRDSNAHTFVSTPRSNPAIVPVRGIFLGVWQARGVARSVQAMEDS